MQRPLFSRNRQGFVAAEPVRRAAAADGDTGPGITLKGVFMSDGVAKAFLVTTQNPLGVWVQVNGQIDGWRVAAVTPEQSCWRGRARS